MFAAGDQRRRKEKSSPLLVARAVNSASAVRRETSPLGRGRAGCTGTAAGVSTSGSASPSTSASASASTSSCTTSGTKPTWYSTSANAAGSRFGRRRESGGAGAWRPAIRSGNGGGTSEPSTAKATRNSSEDSSEESHQDSSGSWSPSTGSVMDAGAAA